MLPIIHKRNPPQFLGLHSLLFLFHLHSAFLYLRHGFFLVKLAQAMVGAGDMLGCGVGEKVGDAVVGLAVGAGGVQSL